MLNVSERSLVTKRHAIAESESESSRLTLN